MRKIRCFAMRAAVLAAVAAMVAGAAGAAEAGKAPPNILLCVADDMGFSDAGCYGGEIETPNIDRLAAGGLRFTQFYNTARCWPSRSCLMTGCYFEQVSSARQARTVAHYLKAAGYRCYHSGKWHVPVAGSPVQAGFERSKGINESQYFSPAGPGGPQHAGPDAGLAYQTDVTAEFAIESLRNHAREHLGEPFFQYLCFHAPHFPLHALQKDIDKYRDRYVEGWDVVRQRRWQRLRELGIVHCGLAALETGLAAPGWGAGLQQALGPGEINHAVPWNELTDEQRCFQATKMAIHAAMVDRVDYQIGRVVEQLKAMGAYDNTVIFFLSDNGASAEILVRGDGHDPQSPPGSSKSFLCLGPGWAAASNAPFRRHKSWVHEGGISTPLVVHWPKGIAAQGELRRDQGHVIDIAPTVLELAGIKYEPPRDGPPMSGQSLVPALAKDGATRRKFVYFNHEGNRALRMGDWKAVSPREDRRSWELYDLSKDRCEQVDLAAKEPQRLKQMADRWETLTAEFAARAKPEGKRPTGAQR